MRDYSTLSLFLLFLGYCLYAQPALDVSVYHAGERGVHTFRIPAIVRTNNGVLLAFAEARRLGGGDTGDIDLVLKRSFDGGETWGEMVTIWDDADNVCGNPCPVVDRRTGEVILLATWNLGSDKESEIHARTSMDTRRIFCLRSQDDGASWSAPEDITGQAKKRSWTWYATGPGHAIQIRDGRLVVPCNHGVFKKGKAAGTVSHVIYSDDGGHRWKRGGNAGVGNESTIAELPDGRLILNMRNWLDGPKRPSGYARLVSISRNRGRSFGRWYKDEALIEPVCQASILSVVSDHGNLLLFSNPRHPRSRKNLTLMASHDNGETWFSTAIISEGPAAYSDLVALDGGEVGVLYEGGRERAHEGIRFARIRVQ